MEYPHVKRLICLGSCTIQKASLKMDSTFDVKPKTIKLSEGNIGKNNFDLELGKNFLHTMPKVWSIKEKIDELKIYGFKRYY